MMKKIQMELWFTQVRRVRSGKQAGGQRIMEGPTAWEGRRHNRNNVVRKSQNITGNRPLKATTGECPKRRIWKKRCGKTWPNVSK